MAIMFEILGLAKLYTNKETGLLDMLIGDRPALQNITKVELKLLKNLAETALPYLEEK